MSIGDLINSAKDKIGGAAKEIVSRPSKDKNADGSKGQAPPGTLTKNVKRNGSMGVIFGNPAAGNQQPNLGTINLVGISQDNPGVLTNNIGNNDLDEVFIQDNPGLLTNNVGNNDLNNPVFVQDTPGLLTNNIGNINLTQHDISQDTPGLLTNNIGNNDLNAPAFTQDNPGILTGNIDNISLNNPLFIQNNPGVLTDNIDNVSLNNPAFIQDTPGLLTQNIGTDLETSYIQDNPGTLTNNVGNNDLDDPLFNQIEPGLLTQNIGTDLKTKFDQSEPGSLTDNINNDLDVRFAQTEPGQLTNNVGENDLDVLFDNKPINDNIGNNLNSLFINPITDKKVELGEQFTQTEAGTLTDNVSNNDIQKPIFQNNVENKNIGNNLKQTYTNPQLIEKTPKTKILFENPENRRKSELSEITTKMRLRKNIGTDLGTI